MKKRINILEVTDSEHSLIINSLRELRKKILNEDKDADVDFIDDLLIKLLDPVVKVRKFGRYIEEER